MEPKAVPHQTFETLSGMRGVAAFCVLVFHVGLLSGRTGLAPHGGLAVDLFFCLSGFVLAHAYGRRLAGGMTVRTFMVARVLRLWPLIVLGALTGGAYAMLKGLLAPEHFAPTATAIATLLAVAVIPYANAPEVIGGPAVFPINGPEWSLFFELVVNLAWVLAFRRLGRRTLWGVAVVAVAGLLWAGFMFGHWTGGGGDQMGNFLGGFPRVTFSFAAGLITYDLYKSGRLPRLRLPPLAVIALTAVILGGPDTPWDGALEPVFVILGGPLLILAAAQHNAASRLDPALWLAGELSYPMYVLQIPVIAWTSGVLKASGVVLSPTANVALLVAAVVAASAVAAFAFDRPIRALLAGRRAGDRVAIAVV